ncbi:MAG: MBL fold metallo-hydrolase, partial [Bradymonadia bacterium]
SFAGPKRFFPPVIALNDLPKLDVILISHDHYDHLDYETVQALKDRNLKWFVPLGVGAHLKHWGVAKSQIVEFDWWEEQTIGDVRLIAVPARHFSGRSLFFTDKNATLWSGWALVGKKRRVFYSGDTALHPEFRDIGERLGPFDVTLMETGAYNQLWCDVHLGPEQAVIAHQLVKGKTMIPVHWGLFDLALHGWTEPAERILQAATLMNVNVSLLAPGEQFSPGQTTPNDRWWAEQPWDTVEKAPVWSTNVEFLQKDYQQRLRKE